ncbi:unnamed protein product [Lactuca saligna]|uniref:DUF4283 domain-containing protein n=1 Tax=Lactuca saligna TaxID=75948 RepID=A0AA36EJA9_LACSI|nr:unnamed protein product [Lactuca saligna]
MFGMNYTDPPDPANKKLYEDELEADVGARRRGRRAVHKEFSPYSVIKPLRLKDKMEANANRLREEKKYLNSKSIADEFIKSELDALDKVIADEKKVEEENGFVLLQVTSDMIKGFNSSKNSGVGLSSSSPVTQTNTGTVIGTNSDKGILDMKDSMNENGNLEIDYGNNMKKEQGANFLNMDFSKPVISPAAKLVSDYKKKSYPRMVESTNTVVDLNIKVIPKVDGKPNGKVELPYADLMLGGAPYHATLYGVFVGKKLAFPTVNHFSFKMWKIFGLKDIMVNDEGFFFFKFDSKEGMMSVLEGGPWLINNVPMFVQRWRPGLVLSKPQMNSVPVWVKVFNVHLEYWNSKGITLIANEIGKPIAMDKITQKMCNEHWGRPAFMRFLVEISAEFEWMKELSVVSIDFGTGEKVESKCKIDMKNDNVADETVNSGKNGKKEQVDDDGFILVTKKNNKGQKVSPGVVINENGKVDLIKSLEKSTIPVSEGVNIGSNEGSSKEMGDQGKNKNKQIEEQENQKGAQKEDRISKGVENRNNGGNFSKLLWAISKKMGKRKGISVKRGQKWETEWYRGVYPKIKLGTRVKNVIENFNARKEGMQVKKEENQKKVYVPKKQVDFKVSSNFDNIGSTSGKDDQDEIISQNPFDVLADLGLRDMSYLDEIDQEILTGGGQETVTEKITVVQ